MAKLVWRVKFVTELQAGETMEVEVARIERDEPAGLSDLGLRLAEAKQLTSALQAEIVPAQVTIAGGHRCTYAACGRRLASKGHFTATFRSLFGDVPIRIRRLLTCPCQNGGVAKSSATFDLEAATVAPELAYVMARYAALAPFGKVADLLSELLPVSGAPNAGTVRNRTMRVGDAIIEKLQEIAGEGIDGYAEDVQEWLDENPSEVDDELKAEALKGLFTRSKVALVYGPAGTGKSTMVDHIANYFADERKLFLAHTNPAVDNLKRRVDAPNSHFSTISSHIGRSGSFGPAYGVVVIDECSFVDNANLLKVLDSTTFDLLVLVGDVYQIESIQFGNWFSLARSYVPKESVFELTTPWRTDDEALLTLWDRVRSLDDRIEESLSKNGYSKALGDELFQRESDDEVILCLNYDGLYGINNVNRFLQASNPSPVVNWGEATYKVGDPVLFNETDRFRPVIFNNLKGTITGIERVPGRITFGVELDREVTESDVRFTDLRWVEGSNVRFDVFERPGSDDDDDEVNTLVPFQLAYAVSIHKAQGLEYDSVKVVITDANEERISHSIFYTAITRARRRLGIFWTAETQQRILSRLAVRDNTKDESLLKARRGVVPLGSRPKRNKERSRP